MWYRSLYWRIGLGFIAVLAVLLLVQGSLFLWLTGQTDEWLPVRSPFRLATLVASDLSAALTRTPDLQIDKYVREQFAHVYQPFFVVMSDGRVASSRDGRVPPGLVRAAREKLGVPARFPSDIPMWMAEGGRGRGAGPGDGRGGRGPADFQRFGAPGGGRGGMPPADAFLAETEPIEVNGVRIGLVIVSTRGEPFVLIRQFGPMLAVVGIGLLALGTAVGTLLIFRPARQRMRQLEDAVAAFGAGDRSARAPERGRDEVTSLARAFNRMAGALETSETVRRRLLADVSHELKTPLTAIRGYAETLSMPEVQLDRDTERRYLRIVGEETERLEAIVGDLLDLARVEGGGTLLHMDAVPVRRLFERVADRHAQAIAEKHLTLESSVAADAQDVWGDPGRLEQALQNLAANAVRHTPPGGRITLAAVSDGGYTSLIVRDTGPGIPPDHLGHLFDRFYKVDASRAGHSATGSGLGLSIVKAVVERHGGDVTAANAEGGGAVFTVRLRKSAVV